jgi:broad specificity phosphatase PhoE
MTGKQALLLVRHAMPAATPEAPPETWPLNPEGLAAARRLRSRLPVGARWCSSAEPKAWQTLGGTDEVALDARFNEVSRVGEPWQDNFRQLRRAYVEGVQHPGWEPHQDAADRFDAGVRDALSEAAGRPVVIATHGMVMTRWLVSRGLVPADRAGPFWTDLRFPDCLAVTDGSVRRAWPG